ncbi:MAG: DEAD/DEAH box helicase [Gammaproteobacteria bacterium]|nr:MAG: DEAD/DEAH box helicase [Gammaproteobacteria bacterium]
MTASIDSFGALGLSEPLLAALADVGYESPSAIQAACIPPLLAGHDLLGEAQTGTGKTAAFALPALQRLDLALRDPQVLVLTPTRELAIQVAEAFQRYARKLPGFQVLPVYGGQGMVAQLRQLQRGAHVVVGTPGRVMDHINRKTLRLDTLQTLVLDEADEMLRMGFVDDVDWILEHTPAERQVVLFSATMAEPIRRIARRHMRKPQEIRIQARTATVAATVQKYCQVAAPHKLDALTRVLETEESLDAALIFVRTKTATVEIADKLEARGYAVAALSGDLTQVLRERVIDQLKQGRLDLIVATDVAARGLDVPRISHVINYDVPYDTEAYVHRIGRTGRAGRSGTAILFVTPREMRLLGTIERATRQKIEPMALPSRAAVADRRVAQFREQVEQVITGEDLAFFREVVRSLVSREDANLEEIAAALAFLAQRERPLQLPPAKGPDIADAARSMRPAPARSPSRAPAAKLAEGGALQRYRIDVGRQHQASPKDIVGAIANETGLSGRNIGRIDLFDDYSTVELPAQLPAEILELLRRTRVRQRPLGLRPLTPAEAEAAVKAKPAGRAKRAPAGKPGKAGARKPAAKKAGRRGGG